MIACVCVCVCVCVFLIIIIFVNICCMSVIETVLTIAYNSVFLMVSFFAIHLGGIK